MIPTLKATPPTPEDRHRAVRALAAQARDADELRELLAMLDLTAGEGRAPVPVPVPARTRGPRKLTIAELTALITTEAGPCAP